MIIFFILLLRAHARISSYFSFADNLSQIFSTCCITFKLSMYVVRRIPIDKILGTMKYTLIVRFVLVLRNLVSFIQRIDYNFKGHNRKRSELMENRQKPFHVLYVEIKMDTDEVIASNYR